MHNSARLAAYWSKRLGIFAEKWAPAILAVFSLGYLALMYRLTPTKPLWIDEYFTLYLSRLPLSEFWQAMRTGAESHPPSFLLLTRATFMLFGSGLFALRLPAVLGFLLMEFCIFRFVAKRTSILLGLMAILVPFATRGVLYAMEARGYGLLLGFTALSLVCWQAADGGRHRKLAVAGLAASLAAATACHYFGALVVLPLAAGELVRYRTTRRLDAGIWAAFTAPAIPLILFSPMIRAGRGYAEHHGLLNTGFDYFSYLLVQGHAILLVLLFAITVYSTLFAGETVAHLRTTRPAFPLHEITAIAGYILLPVVAFIATRMASLPFANRYVLSAVIGITVLFAAVMDVFPERDVIAILVMAGLMVSAGGSYLLRVSRKGPQSEPEDQFLRSHCKPGVPLVASDIDTFFRLAHSGADPLPQKVVYLTNTEASLHYLGFDTSDRVLNDLRHWLPPHIEPYCEYLAKTPEFQVYGPTDVDTTWLARALADDKVPSEFVAVDAGRILLTVRPNSASRFCLGTAK